MAQPCRRRGDGQLSCRAAQGCSTARQLTKKGNPWGRLCAVYAPTHIPFRGGWRLPDPHTPSDTSGPLYPSRSLSVPPFCSLSRVNDPFPFVTACLPFCSMHIQPHSQPFFSALVDPLQQRRLRYFTRRQWPSRIADWSVFWDGQPGRHSPSYQREGGVYRCQRLNRLRLRQTGLPQRKELDLEFRT